MLNLLTQDIKNVLFLALVALAIGITIRFGCARHNLNLNRTSIPTALPSTDVANITVSEHHIDVLTDKGEQRLYVPEDGHANIVIDKQGKVTTTVHQLGLSHKLGGGVVYANEFRFSLDMQLAYYERFGFHAALAFGRNPTILPLFAISYRLDQIHLSNTSVMLGVTFTKGIVGGLRWEF